MVAIFLGAEVLSVSKSFVGEFACGGCFELGGVVFLFSSMLIKSV
jgi:hypothetical protein